MEEMTRRERIKGALNKEEVDRLPYSIWYGLPHVDQDAIAFAELTVKNAKLYNVDFIKVNPNAMYVSHDFGLSLDFYCTPTQGATVHKYGIEDISDWGRLEPLPAIYGTYGRTLLQARAIKKELADTDIPFVQTIFSPLTVANKLAGTRTLEDMRKEPKLMHSALEAITKTMINFVKANLDEGVDGFFCGTNVATTDDLTLEEFEEFEAAYYRRIFDAMGDEVLLKIVHAHGDNTYFKEMAEYPVNCISWHDRTCNGPTMAEARQLTDKCLLGGFDERWLEKADENSIYGHIEETVKAAGSRGLIIGPGCVCKPLTPVQNFLAVANAAKSFQ